MSTVKTSAAPVSSNHVTVILDEPLQRGDTVITEIQLRKPKAGELRGVSLVDVARRALVAAVPVPGRTRWTIYDSQRDVFFVNIADPAQIAVIDASHPTQVAKTFSIPAIGGFQK